jgi:hypothetical protein
VQPKTEKVPAQMLGPVGIARLLPWEQRYFSPFPQWRPHGRLRQALPFQRPQAQLRSSRRHRHQHLSVLPEVVSSTRRGGKVSHVVTIIFDNTHFMRDPARDGSTLVPSDLEQMPHLLNFIK